MTKSDLINALGSEFDITKEALDADFNSLFLKRRQYQKAG